MDTFPSTHGGGGALSECGAHRDAVPFNADKPLRSRVFERLLGVVVGWHERWPSLLYYYFYCTDE